MRILLLTLISMTITFKNYGQVSFQVNDNALSLGNNCYRLTKDSVFAIGTIWSNAQIDLSLPFDFSAKLNFGGHNAGHGTGSVVSGCGADGIVFALQQVSTSVGGAGFGIGYQGIAPSIAVEFDTYKNSYDPSYDHIAILQNGNVRHNQAGSTLAGPVQASPTATLTSIKDSLDHWARFTWNPDSSIFRVYFDCQFRLSYTGNIIDSVFNGNPNVFWGFTSATGACVNYHRVCFENFPEGNAASNTGPVCLGTPVQLLVQGSSNFQYNWSGPSGYSSSEQNPTIDPLTAGGIGAYHVTVSDNGCSLYTAQTTVDKSTTGISDLVIPNVFTPNGDHINDTLRVSGAVTESKIQLFNRWGLKVHESADLSNLWDGKINGAPAPSGVYYYLLSYVNCSNETVEKKGFVTLLGK